MSLAHAPLVPPEALAANLGQANLRLLDFRLPPDGGLESFEALHIPGAAFTDYVKDGWRWMIGGAPGMLPPEAHLSMLLGLLGIAPESHVVIIPTGASANDLTTAARLYWTLKVVGHEAVAILDGGMRGWVADRARPLEAGPSQPLAAGPYPVRPNPAVRSTLAEVERALAAGAAFVDTRTPRYFAGLEWAREARRGGHLPGALWHEYSELFDLSSGRLRPPPELAAMFAGVPEVPVVAYCNTGHTAALTWFALSEVLGRKGVTLYDGSMTEWTQDETRPVEVSGP